MNVVDEMAQDWVKRLCAAQQDYNKHVDLLTVEYGRMSETDREAIKRAVGDKGFVISLASLPSAKCGVALNVGNSPNVQTIYQITRQLPVEALMGLMGLFGRVIYEANAPSGEQVITFISDKVAIAIRLVESLNRQMEEDILNAAKKGQC